jgi:C1A family cysteine protease
MNIDTIKVNDVHGLSSCDAPSSMDWRSKWVVTTVKNQHGCGKLAVFAYIYIYIYKILIDTLIIIKWK